MYVNLNQRKNLYQFEYSSRAVTYPEVQERAGEERGGIAEALEFLMKASIWYSRESLGWRLCGGASRGPSLWKLGRGPDGGPTMSGGGPGTVPFDGICMNVGGFGSGCARHRGARCGLSRPASLRRGGGGPGTVPFDGICMNVGGILCGPTMFGGPIGGGMLPDAAIFCIRFMPNIAACINRGLGCGRFG